MANNGWNAGVVGPNGHQRNQAAHRDLPGPNSVQDSAFPTGQDQAQQYAGAFSSEMFLGADANFISSEILSAPVTESTDYYIQQDTAQTSLNQSAQPVHAMNASTLSPSMAIMSSMPFPEPDFNNYGGEPSMSMFNNYDMSLDNSQAVQNNFAMAARRHAPAMNLSHADGISRKLICERLLVLVYGLMDPKATLRPDQLQALCFIIGAKPDDPVVRMRDLLCQKAMCKAATLGWHFGGLDPMEALGISALTGYDLEMIQRAFPSADSKNTRPLKPVATSKSLVDSAYATTKGPNLKHTNTGRVARKSRASPQTKFQIVRPPASEKELLAMAISQLSERFDGCIRTLTMEALESIKRQPWNEEQPLSCLTGCGLTFKKVSDFKRHLQNNRPWHGWLCNCPSELRNKNGQAYCTFCAQVDPDSDHFKSHHSKKVPCHERAVLKGKRVFVRKNHLQQHFHDVHQGVPRGQTLSTVFFNVPGNFEPQCGFCGKHFDDCEMRLNHIILHFRRDKLDMIRWHEPWEGDSIEDQFPEDEDDSKKWKRKSKGGVEYGSDDDDGDDDDDDDDEDDNHSGGVAGNGSQPEANNPQPPHHGSGWNHEHDQDGSQDASRLEEFFGNVRHLCGLTNTGTTETLRFTIAEVDAILRHLQGSSTSEIAKGLHLHQDMCAVFKRDDMSHYTLRMRRHSDIESHSLLGYGGSSVVDRVRLQGIDGYFARKQMKFQEKGFDLLLQEFSVLSKVQHGHITRLEGIILQDRTCSLLLSPVADKNLATYLQGQHGPQRFNSTDLGCLVRAVKAVHDAGLTHGDLKPGNVLLERRGGQNHLWLCDFGAAQDGSGGVKRMWTPRFAAPEEKRQTGSSMASDIFSLGCVLFEMMYFLLGLLTGNNGALDPNKQKEAFRYSERPGELQAWLRARAQPRRCREHPLVSRHQLLILSRMLDLLPRNRPSMVEILQAFPANACCSTGIVKGKLTQDSAEAKPELYTFLSEGKSNAVSRTVVRVATHEHSHSALSSPRSFRLLKLRPNRADAEIIEVTLEKHPEYQAVSYVWGDSTKSEHVTVHGAPMAVNPNAAEVFEALRALSSSTQRYWWIDSLCINHTDAQERAEQVTIMSNIYHQAQRVLVWLGKIDRGIVKAVHMLHDYLLDSRFIPPKSRDKAWHEYRRRSVAPNFSDWDIQASISSLNSLLRRPYWSRVWVAQELALAKNAAILCGDEMLDWRVLTEVIAGIVQATNTLVQPYPKTSEPAPFRLVFKTESDLRAFTRALETYNASSHLRMLMKTDGNHQLGLLDLLGYFRSYDCLDARDYVYAFLALPTDIDRHGLSVDYKMSADEVFLRTAKALLQSGHTDLLAFCDGGGGGVYTRILPSWVPDWSNKYRSQICMKSFSASRGFSSYHPSICSFEEPNVLRISGSEVDRIEEIYPYGQGTDADALKSLKDSIRRKSRIREQYEDLTEAFTHTTIADREPQKLRGWQRIGRRTLGLLSSKPDHIYRGHHKETLPAEFLTTVRMFGETKSLFSTQLGYIGLGSKELKVGDMIAIFYGAGVPFALRPTTNGMYRLIGECYIHGIMDGEFVATSPQVADFRIE